MGVEFHITRAEHWADNDGSEISADEWLQYVESDKELQAQPENGRYYVRWLGESKHNEPWFDWFQGNVFTKWPDAALYRKMLSIANTLGGQVQDDDGTVYMTEGEWTYDPTALNNDLPAPSGQPGAELPRSWWQRLIGK